MKRYLSVSVVLLCILFLMPLVTVVTHVVQKVKTQQTPEKEQAQIELLPPAKRTIPIPSAC